MSVNEKMTAIADAIREKTGGTDALTLDKMAEAIPEVYGAGKQSEYDKFWDAFQQNGERTDYGFAFYKWNDLCYDPKYDISITNGQQGFRYSTITNTRVPITLKDGCNAVTLFNSCTQLVTIPKLILEASVKTLSGAFISCSALQEIEFEGVIDTGVNFSDCKALSYESLMNIITHLGKVQTSQTLTLGTENLAKLTDAEKAIATQKGWTLA